MEDSTPVKVLASNKVGFDDFFGQSVTCTLAYSKEQDKSFEFVACIGVAPTVYRVIHKGILSLQTPSYMRALNDYNACI